MTDKEKEELAVVLLLAFDGRDPDDIARAIVRAVGDNYWQLSAALDRATHAKIFYSRTVDGLREELAEGYSDPEGDDRPERFVESMSDDDIYNAMMAGFETPDTVYDCMNECWMEWFAEMREKKLIEYIPKE
jgi:hypothetical protein